MPLASITKLLDRDVSDVTRRFACYLMGAFLYSPAVSPGLTVFALYFLNVGNSVWIIDQSSATRFKYSGEFKFDICFASKVNLIGALMIYRRGQNLK